jgi:hypothetical protein
MQPHELNSVFDTSERRKKIAIVGDVFRHFSVQHRFSPRNDSGQVDSAISTSKVGHSLKPQIELLHDARLRRTPARYIPVGGACTTYGMHVYEMHACKRSTSARNIRLQEMHDMRYTSRCTLMGYTLMRCMLMRCA